MAVTLTTAPMFEVSKVPIDADGRITHLWGNPTVQGVVVSSTVRVNLPNNLQITNTDTHEHCPAFINDGVGRMVAAIGPDSSGEYLLVDGSVTVELKTDNCETHRIFTESSVGPVGPKGESGTSGTGVSGGKGEIGEKGEVGETGSTGGSGGKGEKGSGGDAGDKGSQGSSGSTGGAGSKGEQGSLGEDGEKGSLGESGEGGDKGSEGSAGSKGSKGEGLDWNDTQQSILIGGTKFGPRLIGVCQNGTYKYVYVFASDPTS